MLLKHKPTQSPPGANLTPCSWRKKTRRRRVSIVLFSKGKWHQNLSVGIFSQSWLNTNIAKSKVSRDFMDSTTRYRGFTAGSAEESTCHCEERQETQVQPLGGEGPLEEEMATHSSILAWKLPWTEEPGGVESKELQRVVRD